MDVEYEPVQFSLSDQALWMPVYTQPRHEFRLYHYFQERGIPAYLPVIPKIKLHHVHAGKGEYDYRHTVMRPMFRSYVFARLDEEQKRSVWRSNSVVHIWPVPPEQQQRFLEELRGVRMMEHLARNNTELKFHPDIQVKDRFLIESPPYEGTYGYLLKKRKRFLWVVKMELFNMAIEAEIDPSEFKMSKVEG